MSDITYLVFVAGMMLEALLISRLVLGRFWRYCPYFFAYVVFFVAQSAALFVVLRWLPANTALVLGNLGFANLGLRFLIVGEVFRQAFPAGSSLRRVVASGFTVVGLMVTTVVLGMLWGIEIYGKSHLWNLAFERSFGFAQAVLILLILNVARYYHVQLGREHLGYRYWFWDVQLDHHREFRIRRFIPFLSALLAAPGALEFGDHADDLDLGHLGLCPESGAVSRRGNRQ